MAKIAEANERLFKNVFICKKCQSKMRADAVKILEGKVRCRSCKGRSFRTVKKK